MGFLDQGKVVEQAFIKLLGGEYIEPTAQQDMLEHWDKGVAILFDVKKIKKINRYDDVPNENIHWVETKNVNGDAGWIDGKAHYFPFETEDYFVVVGRDDLKKLLNHKTINNTSPIKELYHKYWRDGRKDEMVMVKTIDLMAYATCVLHKNKIGGIE